MDLTPHANMSLFPGSVFNAVFSFKFLALRNSLAKPSSNSPRALEGYPKIQIQKG